MVVYGIVLPAHSALDPPRPSWTSCGETGFRWELALGGTYMENVR